MYNIIFSNIMLRKIVKSRKRPRRGRTLTRRRHNMKGGKHTVLHHGNQNVYIPKQSYIKILGHKLLF